MGDVELVRRCVARAPGAWRQFVDRFAPTVLALARRYLRHLGRGDDLAAAEDVVQEVFLALMQRNHKLLREYDETWTVKTWLGVITRTQVHRATRRRRPLTAGDERLEAHLEPDPDPTRALERAEETDRLTEALKALPERDAALLRLRFLEERDYRAIAGILNVPEASVGQLLFRAKQRLLEQLRGGSRREGGRPDPA